MSITNHGYAICEQSTICLSDQRYVLLCNLCLPLKMDNVSFVHIVDPDIVCSVNTPMKMFYEFHDGEMTKMCRFVDSVSIIVPLAVHPVHVLRIISKILQDSLIENIATNAPCTVAGIALAMDSLIFVCLVNKGDKLVAYVEAMRDRRIIRHSICSLHGTMEYIIEKLYEMFCRIGYADGLYDQLYVFCPDDDLCKHFYRQLEAHLNTRTGQHKSIKELHVDERLASHQQFKFSEKNPLYIGLWLLTKIRFHKTNHYTTRDSFLKRDLSLLSIDS